MTPSNISDDNQSAPGNPAEPQTATPEESIDRLEAEKFRLETLVCYLLQENQRLRSAASSPPGDDPQ